MKKTYIFVFLLTISLTLGACKTISSTENTPKPKNITISAASSLKDVLMEIQSKFEKQNSIKLTLNLQSSGILQKQIEEGAPADLFISAGNKQMDELEKKNLIDTSSKINLLNNKLVLIVSDDYKNKVKSLDDLVTIKDKISMGDPSSVPAGHYGKESLEYLNLMDKLSDKIVYAKDVRQVVTYVENNDVAAGIVYKSDALALKNSFILLTFEENSHLPIVYPAAVIKASKEKEASNKFLQYLNSSDAQKIFEAYGFEIYKK
jgi:molybdate transport system substrate-binding protein